MTGEALRWLRDYLGIHLGCVEQGGAWCQAPSRYLLGPLYLLMGEIAGAVKSFEWFEQTFPDDVGEPVHFLCWTLALYRSGDAVQAAHRLRQTMLSNL